MRKYFICVLFVLTFVANRSGMAQQGSTDYQYALIEAVKQKNLGNIPGAIELYKMVLQENDSVAIAYYELGSLYLMVNQPEEAESFFRKAYQLDNRNEWFINGYIDILVIKKKFEEAEKLVETILVKSEDELDYRFKLANIYFLGGKHKKAIKCLNRIEKKYGVSDKIILLKANVFEDEEKFNAARKEIEKLIEFFPESIQFYIVAAELALKANQRDLSSKYYDEVLEIDSTNIYALTNLTDYYRIKKEHDKSLFYLKKSFESDFIEYDRKMAILSYYLTDTFFLQNYSDQLLELIEVVLKKHPGEKDIKLYAIDFYVQRRDYKSAFATLEPILTSKEKNYELWRQGILLANALSDNVSLLKLSTGAVKIFPDSVEVIYFKGVAEFENEMYDEVINTFNTDKISGYGNIELVLQTKQILAESYHKLEHFQQADSLFRIIIKEQPNNYLVLNNFSYYLAMRGESLEEARILSYRTIIENPENGTFLDTYAWILYKLGEYKEAESYINKALQKGGLNDPDVNEHAGEIQLKLKSYHIAQSFFEKAIILGGDKEKIEERIKSMQDLYEK